MHGAIHSEQARVLTGSITALAVSFTGIMDGLRATLLVVMIAYNVLKFVKGLKSKKPEE